MNRRVKEVVQGHTASNEQIQFMILAGLLQSLHSTATLSWLPGEMWLCWHLKACNKAPRQAEGAERSVELDRRACGTRDSKATGIQEAGQSCSTIGKRWTLFFTLGFKNILIFF